MQFKIKHITYALITSGVLLSSNIAIAADADIDALRKTIEELDQKIKIIERKNEIAAEEAAAKKKETPVVVAGPSGFAIKSADGQFEYALKGLLQLDYRTFDSQDFPRAAPDGFTARRIRPTFQGTLFGKYDFRFTPEFGEASNTDTNANSGNISRVIDAYVDGRFDPAFKIRAGKAKPFVGLERLQGGGDIKFIERSYVSNNILPNRGLGVSAYGDLFDNKLSYAVGIFNGTNDGGEETTKIDVDNDKDYAARIFTTPFKGSDSVLEGLGFGLAGTYTDSARGTLPSYKTPAQQLNFFAYTNTIGDGKRVRLSPQAYYYYGPFGLITEYASVSQDVRNTVNGSTDKLKNDAWQIAGSWLLTGEDASFKGVKPKRPFETGKEGWGAWELIARYQQNTIDSDAFTSVAGAANAKYADPRTQAKEAKTWGVGVNWYLNQWVKLSTSYELTKFDGGGSINKLGAATGALTNVDDRDDERILFSRLQFQF
ncbi:MAG: OprO/OprP family phosphate-selective porin [Methylophilaceae bacterium]